MAKLARIRFDGAFYDLPADLVPSVIEKLVELTDRPGGGGASVLKLLNDAGEETTLFWTPGAPITFETWDSAD